MRKLFAEPLFQFAVLGLLLFIIVNLLAPAQLVTDDASEIKIDQAALQQYLQFQQKTFNAEAAARALELMPPLDEQRLVEDYVRDEALYREALALGLDDNDEIIRRRLIQKMEYLAQGFYDDAPAISEEAMQDYFAANQAQYEIDAAVTFTHVFLPGTNRETSESEATVDPSLQAQQLLSQLNTEQVPFERAGRYGQRFLYNQNYVERTQQHVVTHFGQDFAKRLFELEAGSVWQGPIQSDYGTHLVMISSKTAARSPALDEVAQIVLADLQAEQRREVKATAIKTLVDKYTVTDLRENASQ
ncbi:MAG: peptidylprolyl isomerase [Pseudomonadota bacterium]